MPRLQGSDGMIDTPYGEDPVADPHWCEVCHRRTSWDGEPVRSSGDEHLIEWTCEGCWVTTKRVWADYT